MTARAVVGRRIAVLLTAGLVLALSSSVFVTGAGAQQAPGVPGGVRVVEVGGDTIVTWTRPAGRPTTYRVQFRTNEPTPRIVGGVPASTTDAPYQAAVFLPQSFCGGTMVTDQIVVTAAHCVAEVTRASDIGVATGELRLSRIPLSERVPVASFEIHPGYVHARADFRNDVAVLRLSRPITDAVTIPIATDPATPTAGTPARISGWGTIRFGGPQPDQLQFADVEIRSDPGARCPDYGSDFRGDIMLCAGAPGGSGGIDTCQGDSGGPLVIEEAGRLVLAGITSWGNGCGQARFPGVYTRVSTFADWILEQIDGSGWTTRTVRCRAKRCQLRIPGFDAEPRTEFRVAAVRSGRTSPYSSTSVVDTLRPGRCDHDADGRADLVIGAPAATVRGRAGAGSLAAYAAAETPVIGFDQRRGALGEIPGDGDGFATTVACGDFDGDGFGDLAIGVPGERVEGAGAAGLVHVLYGRADGLAPARAQRWHEGAGGLAGRPDAGDRFGSALAVGDLDGDGIDDLAIGVPGETVRGRAGAGAVHVLYGSLRRLRGIDSETWTQVRPGMATSVRAGDRFGSALTVGDFDGDGRADLAVGVPGERRGGRSDAGMVQVLAGGARRLAPAGAWHQAARGGLEGRRRTGAGVGSVLVSGDLTGDGTDDLVVGAPTARVGRANRAGEVHVVAGSPRGLDASSTTRWTENRVGRGSGTGNAFGSSLAVGDLDGAGPAELVVGAPGSAGGRGSVFVIADALGSATATSWSPGDRGIRVPVAGRAAFGAAVAAVDLDGDGRDDLAVGAPGASFRGIPAAGRVQIMTGTSATGAVMPSRSWHRATRGVPGRPASGEGFGASIAS